MKDILIFKNICKPYSSGIVSIFLLVQRLELAKAMEKIFESNEMPEDLAGDNYKFVYEYLEYQNMPLNIFTQSFF